MPWRDSPDVVFQQIPLTRGAHVRQCDPLPVLQLARWSAVRALLQHLLHDVFPLLVIMLHLAVAFSQLRARRRVEPVTFHQVRPVTRFSPAFIAWRIKLPSRRRSLLTCNSLNSSLYGESAPLSLLFQTILCPLLFDRESPPHSFDESIRSESGRQSVSRDLTCPFKLH